MPIEGIAWNPFKRAVEVHVLQGTTSPDLRVSDLLFIRRNAHNDPIFETAKHYLEDLANAGDVTLTFTIADASADAGKSTRSFDTLGITLDRTTGAVTAPASLPGLFPQNFLLEVEAVSGGTTYRELIRVHLHRSIQKIWLTPNPMTVRPRRDATLAIRARFALRARFDDDAVGDITNWEGVAWTPPTKADSATGFLTVNAADAAGPPIEIGARLLAHPSVPEAKADLRVLDPWSPANPILARLVPGGGFAKPSSIDAVPNVLFLPDGFPGTAEAKDKFHTYVNKLVAFIKRDTICKPYDVLAGSINFWAAFIPSPQAGITWGSEVHTSTISSGGVTSFPTVSALPRPERPQGTSDPWDVERLIYEVGLPAPRDRFANGARTNKMIVDDWFALFGPIFLVHLPSNPEDPTDDKPRNALIDEWRKLGDRRILDDLDTPLSVMSGAPRVDVYHDVMDLNPDRFSRSALDDLLSSVQHEDVATSALQLGGLWTDPRKRDYDLVCLITVGPGREQNGTGYFLVSQQLVTPFGAVSGVNDITLDPTVILDDPGELEPRVFVHEFSHSFDLGDEYSAVSDRPLFRIHQEVADRTMPNLQSPLSVERAGAIHGDEIKWRWHRIRWAAEIIGPVTPSGGAFEVSIRPSHAFAIPKDQIVHLRFRDIHYAYRDVHFDERSSYLVKEPLLSPPLKLEDMRVSGSPPVFTLVLRPDSTAHFDHPPGRILPPDAFIAGCIVYCPTRAPASVFDALTYPYAELIAKNVRDHITLTKTATGRPDAKHSVPEIPAFPPGFLPISFSNVAAPRVVGLYEGGMGNMTGIFHPTGLCMMNRPGPTKKELIVVKDVGMAICHVCKYALVDAIDPSRHLFIDPDYEAIYPQR